MKNKPQRCDNKPWLDKYWCCGGKRWLDAQPANCESMNCEDCEYYVEEKEEGV